MSGPLRLTLLDRNVLINEYFASITRPIYPNSYDNLQSTIILRPNSAPKGIPEKEYAFKLDFYAEIVPEVRAD